MAVISWRVPMVKQGSNPICWVACAAMLLAHKRNSSITIGSLIGSDPSNSSIGNPAGGSWNKNRRILEKWGFHCVTPNVSPGPEYIEGILKLHGPFMLLHRTEGFPYDSRFGPFCSPLLAPNSSHAVVITGIDTSSHNCLFNNPWGTSDKPVSIAIVGEAIEAMSTPQTFPIAYL